MTTWPSVTMPDWRDVAIGRVHDSVSTHNHGDGTNPNKRRDGFLTESVFTDQLVRFMCWTTPTFTALVKTAARVRGVNQATYIRRVMAVAIAHDLHMPVLDVLYHSPGTGAWGAGQDVPGSRDSGAEIDNWCPHPDCNGSHLNG